MNGTVASANKVEQQGLLDKLDKLGTLTVAWLLVIYFAVPRANPLLRTVPSEHAAVFAEPRRCPAGSPQALSDHGPHGGGRLGSPRLAACVGVLGAGCFVCAIARQEWHGESPLLAFVGGWRRHANTGPISTRPS